MLKVLEIIIMVLVLILKEQVIISKVGQTIHMLKAGVILHMQVMRMWKVLIIPIL